MKHISFILIFLATFSSNAISQLSFSTDTLNFGTAQPGKQRTITDGVINNNTKDTVTVSGIVPETPGSPYSITSQSSFVILAGGTAQISVTFAPTVIANYFEKFDVATSGGSVFHFYAKGISGAPKVFLEKSVLDFGKVILKHPDTLTDQFGNIGSASLNIVSTNNTNPSEYAILGDQGSKSYESGHFIIFSIIFSPQVHSDTCTNHDGQYIMNFDDGTNTTISFIGCDILSNDVKQTNIVTSATSLGSNYPNPFSASTTIPFIINERNYITLEVLDELGRTAATLANGIYEIGNYEVKFNADNLTSASYFVRLRAGKENFTESIMLTK